MNQIFCLALCVASLLFLPTINLLAAEIQIGDTKITVQRKLGQPKGETKSGDRESFYYEKGVVRFINGRVVKSDIMTDGELYAQERRKDQERILHEQQAQIAAVQKENELRVLQFERQQLKISAEGQRRIRDGAKIASSQDRLNALSPQVKFNNNNLLYITPTVTRSYGRQPDPQTCRNASATQIGDSTFCSDGTSAQRIGSSTFYSDGTSAQRIGNSTFFSDGTTAQRIGNSTFYNDGTTAQQIGNFTFFSDGTTANRIGNTVLINK